MLKVGLTGGIGSGKSTIARLFNEKGAYVVDFDRLVHQAEERGNAVWQSIVDTFGEQILNEDNTINRVKLGEIVFGDRKRLEILNSIVHPAVFAQWKEAVDGICETRKDAVIIADIPLLIEVGWQDRFDMVVLVYVSPDIQIERIMKRDGCSRKHALERLHSQMPIDDKIAYADFVIRNEGPLHEVDRLVDKVWIELREMEHKKRKGGGCV
jgi:dephospho-CoA kinase